MPRRADRNRWARGPEGAGGGLGCEAVRDRLDAWLDGELEVPEDRAVQAHLDDCAGCREELARARRLREALGDELPMLACPPEVTEGVLAAVAREESRPAGPWDRLGELAGRLAGPGALRPALAAAALLLLLVAAPLLYRAVVEPGAGDSDRDGAPAVTADGPEAPGPVTEPEYTPEEVARAEEEARLVLAYVAAVGRDAGDTVQEEVFAQGLARPARRLLQGLEGGGLGVDASALEEPADAPRREP
ncbi:MAG: zf-HC2 domain-containing protein [Thermoanaerobaculia bacterium]